MININSDFKKIIFSFLRKKPKKICFYCKDVCIWNKKVKEYYYAYYVSSGTLYCIDCYSLYLQTLSLI
jgi:hypothetical protein